MGCINIKLAIIQMSVGFDKAENINRACGLITAAARENIDAAILPEMFCCPYSGKYFFDFSEEEYAPESDNSPAQAALSALAKKLGVIIVGGSMPERAGGKIFNTSYVYDETGTRIAKHRKAHLFDANVKNGIKFTESDYLSAGNEITTFETRFGAMGLCVCFDFRFPEMARAMALRGASVIFVPAAFNMTTGPAHWETMFRQRAADNQLFAVGAAPARDTNGVYVSYGNSMIADPWGGVTARCGAGEETLIAELDLSRVSEIRGQLPLLSARRTDLYN